MESAEALCRETSLCRWLGVELLVNRYSSGTAIGSSADAVEGIKVPLMLVAAGPRRKGRDGRVDSDPGASGEQPCIYVAFG